MLLKDGATRISENLDGTSQTIAFIESAGRDERFVSQYAEAYVSYSNPTVTLPVRGAGPAGGTAALHRFWRWADPGNALRHFGSAQ